MTKENSSQAKGEINKTAAKKAVLVFRAVNHPLRQRIAELLQEEEAAGRKMTVTDLYIKLRLEQSVASQHLAIMRRQGVVKTERSGKFIYYRVDTERIDAINEAAEKLVG